MTWKRPAWRTLPNYLQPGNTSCNSWRVRISKLLRPVLRAALPFRTHRTHSCLIILSRDMTGTRGSY